MWKLFHDNFSLSSYIFLCFGLLEGGASHGFQQSSLHVDLKQRKKKIKKNVQSRVRKLIMCHQWENFAFTSRKSCDGNNFPSPCKAVDLFLSFTTSVFAFSHLQLFICRLDLSLTAPSPIQRKQSKVKRPR